MSGICEDVPKVCRREATWALSYIERPTPDVDGEGYTYNLCQKHALEMVAKLSNDDVVKFIEIDRL